MTDKKATIKKRILELFESKGTRFPVSAEYVTLKVAHGSRKPARIWERNLRRVEDILCNLAAKKQIGFVEPSEEITEIGYIPPMRTIAVGDTTGHNNLPSQFKASDMDADTLACGESPEKR